VFSWCNKHETRSAYDHCMEHGADAKRGWEVMSDTNWSYGYSECHDCRFYEKQNEKLKAKLTAVTAERDEARERIRVLEDALHWYAGTGKRGEFSIVDANNAWIGDLVDWGDKARAALSKAREASDDKGGATK
jgi:hypothetical protein